MENAVKNTTLLNIKSQQLINLKMNIMMNKQKIIVCLIAIKFYMNKVFTRIKNFQNYTVRVLFYPILKR